MMMVIFNFRRCYCGKKRHYRLNTYLLQLCHFFLGFGPVYPGHLQTNFYPSRSVAMGWNGFRFIFSSVFLLLFSIAFFISSTIVWYDVRVVSNGFLNWELGRRRARLYYAYHFCFFIMRWRWMMQNCLALLGICTF
jgi:hypothetical protein